MSDYTATVQWLRETDAKFTAGQYSRAHEWQFDGGQTIKASAAPAIVPAPWSDPAGVDPEEAFVASLSSCHMLFFLDLAARRGFVIDSYTDQAVGTLAKTEDGKQRMTRVVLNPQVSFSTDPQPDQQAIAKLHHRAHELCFIANSVSTEVIVNG